MALIELSKVDRGWTRRPGPASRCPPTQRLAAIITGQVTTPCPAATRRALLLAAVR